MKTNKQRSVKSLDEQVRWQLRWLGFGLFATCLILVLAFALRSTTSTTNILMQLEAKSLLRQVREFPELPLPRGDALSAYRQWNEIPESLRQHFANSRPVSGKAVEAVVRENDSDPEYLYLMRYIDEQSNEIFLLNRHDETEVVTAYNAFFKTALNQALLLTSLIFLPLFFLIRWLIHRTTQPLSLLSQWSNDLANNPEQSLDVSFPIEELNRIASQLFKGMTQVQAYNQREKQFLKHASHELRTPLAIIQASLDTLELRCIQSNKSTVQRALKASANMRQLSATLLWLARESEHPIEKSWMGVRQLCEQIINDHRYLLSNRAVTMNLQITIERLEIESDLLSIVIANLVRNAFQHSAAGIITFQFSATELVISNPACSDYTTHGNASAEGYGLGLQLVQRICAKMAWQFGYKRTAEFVCVSVNWG